MPFFLQQGLNILHCASMNNHEGILQFVSDSLEIFDVNDVEKDERTALHLAASKGHLDIVKKLLDMKVELNRKDNVRKIYSFVSCIGELWGVIFLDVALCLTSNCNFIQRVDAVPITCKRFISAFSRSHHKQTTILCNISRIVIRMTVMVSQRNVVQDFHIMFVHFVLIGVCTKFMFASIASVAIR